MTKVLNKRAGSWWGGVKRREKWDYFDGYARINCNPQGHKGSRQSSLRVESHEQSMAAMRVAHQTLPGTALWSWHRTWFVCQGLMLTGYISEEREEKGLRWQWRPWCPDWTLLKIEVASATERGQVARDTQLPSTKMGAASLLTVFYTAMIPALKRV